MPDCETSSPTSLIPSKTTDAAVSEERMGKMGKMGKEEILCHTMLRWHWCHSSKCVSVSRNSTWYKLMKSVCQCTMNRHHKKARRWCFLLKLWEPRGYAATLNCSFQTRPSVDKSVAHRDAVRRCRLVFRISCWHQGFVCFPRLSTITNGWSMFATSAFEANKNRGFKTPFEAISHTPLMMQCEIKII